MLIIEFLNVSKGADVSDYDVTVRVNHRVIHTETIKGHVRAAGWKALVLRLADKELETAARQLAEQAKLQSTPKADR